MFKIGAVLGGALLYSASAFGVTYNFSCITGNITGDCEIGEAQFSMEVTASDGLVSFMFINTGPEPSSIARIYFEDTLGLLTYDSHTSHPSVDYVWGSASPPDLPGGNEIGFETTDGMLASATPPRSHNGIGSPDEFVDQWLEILFVGDLAAILAALDADPANLRVGLHAIAFASKGSESFVSVPMPLPGAGWLMLGAVVPWVAAKRRRNESRKVV